MLKSLLFFCYPDSTRSIRNLTFTSRSHYALGGGCKSSVCRRPAVPEPLRGVGRNDVTPRSGPCLTSAVGSPTVLYRTMQYGENPAVTVRSVNTPTPAMPRSVLTGPTSTWTLPRTSVTFYCRCLSRLAHFETTWLCLELGTDLLR